MRSSSEWNATTTSRPPSRSTASAAASACASSSSSRLMKMRSAWKVRVAGWMRDGAGRAGGRRDDLGELAGALDRRLGARPLDGAGDASGLPLLAEHADDRRELLRRCAVHDAQRRRRRSLPMRMSSGPVEAEGEAALRLARAAWRRRRRRARRRRPARSRPRRHAHRDRRSGLRRASAVRRTAPTSAAPASIALRSRSMASTLPPRSRMARV